MRKYINTAAIIIIVILTSSTSYLAGQNIQNKETLQIVMAQRDLAIAQRNTSMEQRDAAVVALNQTIGYRWEHFVSVTLPDTKDRVMSSLTSAKDKVVATSVNFKDCVISR
jgi:sugar/nucleoside kinase (ribokinase family)